MRNSKYSATASIGLRTTMADALKVVKDKEDWGFFIDSCFTHCQMVLDVSWNSHNSPRLGNKVGSSKSTINHIICYPMLFLGLILFHYHLIYGADRCRSCWRLAPWKDARSERG
uniref:Pectin acetylesterase n=1 Tax=Aegilops tauschii subsp. strangulata TaxID=200361 RepID=A0A453GXJ7_AEGTS